MWIKAAFSVVRFLMIRIASVPAEASREVAAPAVTGFLVHSRRTNRPLPVLKRPGMGAVSRPARMASSASISQARNTPCPGNGGIEAERGIGIHRPVRQLRGIHAVRRQPVVPAEPGAAVADDRHLQQDLPAREVAGQGRARTRERREYRPAALPSCPASHPCRRECWRR